MAPYTNYKVSGIPGALESSGDLLLQDTGGRMTIPDTKFPPVLVHVDEQDQPCALHGSQYIPKQIYLLVRAFALMGELLLALVDFGHERFQFGFLLDEGFALGTNVLELLS
jgi:hypothetical protein